MTRASEARVALVFATFGIVNELASAASTVLVGAAVVGARAQCLARAARVTSMKLRHAAVLSLLSPAAAALRPCAVAPLRRCASATRLGSTPRVVMVDAAPMPATPPVPGPPPMINDWFFTLLAVGCLNALLVIVVMGGNLKNQTFRESVDELAGLNGQEPTRELLRQRAHPDRLIAGKPGGPIYEEECGMRLLTFALIVLPTLLLRPSLLGLTPWAAYLTGGALVYSPLALGKRCRQIGWDVFEWWGSDEGKRMQAEGRAALSGLYAAAVRFYGIAETVGLKLWAQYQETAFHLWLTSTWQGSRVAAWIRSRREKMKSDRILRERMAETYAREYYNKGGTGRPPPVPGSAEEKMAKAMQDLSLRVQAGDNPMGNLADFLPSGLVSPLYRLGQLFPLMLATSLLQLPMRRFVSVKLARLMDPGAWLLPVLACSLLYDKLVLVRRQRNRRSLPRLDSDSNGE